MKNLRSKSAAGKRASPPNVHDRQLAEPPPPSADDAAETARLVADARRQGDGARHARRGQQRARVHVEPTDEERRALRRQRERELREEERRGGERHVLAYWRKHFGGRLPRAAVDDPWATPMFKAGPAALLLLAPLNDAADAQAFLRTVSPRGAVKPSLEQLRKGAALVRLVGLAIAQGDALVWKQLARAYELAFEEATIRRVIVLDAVEHAVHTVERVRESSEWAKGEGIDDDEEDAAGVVREAAAEALETLQTTEGAFAEKLTLDVLLAELQSARRGKKTRGGQWKGGAGNVYTAGIAAKLSVACGAFGDKRIDAARRAFLGSRGRTHT